MGQTKSATSCPPSQHDDNVPFREALLLVEPFDRLQLADSWPSDLSLGRERQSPYLIKQFRARKVMRHERAFIIIR